MINNSFFILAEHKTAIHVIVEDKKGASHTVTFPPYTWNSVKILVKLQRKLGLIDNPHLFAQLDTDKKHRKAKGFFYNSVVCVNLNCKVFKVGRKIEVRTTIFISKILLLFRNLTNELLQL
jgi:hypothetical protein